ncbi:hypothetical protein BH23GEM7_BH23GEM7_31170 [soil metagenome]
MKRATLAPLPLRAVVVGAGLMGRWHAHALVRSGGSLRAIIDPRAERAHALAASYAGARVFPDLEALLAAERVDVVHICTPAETHVELAGLAITGGCHTLVEKPLAPSAAATAELLRLAAERQVLLCPVHQFLFQPGVLRLQREIHRITPLLHIDSVACSAGAEGLGEEARDRVAFDILPHPLSLLARLLPRSFGAADWQLLHPAAGELRVTGVAEGASLSLLLSMNGRPTCNLLRVIGGAGTAHLDLFHGFSVIESGAVSRTRKILKPITLSGRQLAGATHNLLRRALRWEPAYPGLRELVRRFYGAARANRSAPVTPEEILTVTSTLDRLRALC